MNVTKVSIRQVDMNKVKAIASITIDDDFVVHDLRIVEGERGLFVAMPSRKLPSGNFRDVAHPINTETREMVQDVVLKEYKHYLSNPTDSDSPPAAGAATGKESEGVSSLSDDLSTELSKVDETLET